MNKKYILVAMTALAAPSAFGLETLLRKVLFPPEFEEVRATLSDLLTIPTWVVAILVFCSLAAGVVFQKRQLNRKLAQLQSATVKQKNEAAMGVFMLSASIPQIPAILATLMFMFGAELMPVAVTMAVSCLGVLLLAYLLFSDERLRA